MVNKEETSPKRREPMLSFRHGTKATLGVNAHRVSRPRPTRPTQTRSRSWAIVASDSNGFYPTDLQPSYRFRFGSLKAAAKRAKELKSKRRARGRALRFGIIKRGISLLYQEGAEKITRKWALYDEV